jgi:hypothetical protein
MAYTNAWSNVIPAGTVMSDLIDDHIRQLRLDIAERMASLVEDWTTDPVEPKAIWKGTVVGKKLIIPASNIIMEHDAGMSIVDSGAGVQPSTGRAVLPLLLPPGVTVTLVELLADRRGNAFITWHLYRKSFSGAAAVSQADVIHNVAGDVISDTGVLAMVIDVDAYYYIDIEASGSAKDLYAACVTYDTPDSRNTI